ncbi:hypothetical protein T05_3843 [Trichinella murrelli]|uniref:Uncharacterized protein n=1 Tax=Trichinella murrelli TaxID=144512 RepID=A0A0V0TFA1_9BILA|nr:hypothetical protein T05_3843 [Trichinella murrelli]
MKWESVKSVIPIPSELNFEEYATIDDQLQVTHLMSNREITNSIAKTNDDADNSHRSKIGVTILYCASWRLILMRRIMALCEMVKNSTPALQIFTAGYGLRNSFAALIIFCRLRIDQMNHSAPRFMSLDKAWFQITASLVSKIFFSSQHEIVVSHEYFGLEVLALDDSVVSFHRLYAFSTNKERVRPRF